MFTVQQKLFTISATEAQQYIWRLVNAHWYVGDECSEQLLFSYVAQQNQIKEAQYMRYMYQDNTLKNNSVLCAVYCFPIGKNYIVHALWRNDKNLSYRALSEKLYIALLQQPSHKLQRIKVMLEHLQQSLLYIGINSFRYATLMTVLLRAKQLAGLEDKQLQLYVLTIQLQHGAANTALLQREISRVNQNLLTVTEVVALHYICFEVSVRGYRYDDVITNARKLLHKEQLSSNAIKLLFMFEGLLPALPPNTATLLKNYQNNYMERFYWHYINALVKTARYTEAYNILACDVVASCEQVYALINKEDNIIELTMKKTHSYDKFASSEHIKNISIVCQAVGQIRVVDYLHSYK